MLVAQVEAGQAATDAAEPALLTFRWVGSTAWRVSNSSSACSMLVMHVAWVDPLLRTPHS